MDGMGEEEFKKCLESLGYVSEKESDSNFEETKSECDELYERYKPPARKIDPKKSKIIILNDNGGSELSLNSNIKKNGKKKRNRNRKKKKKSSATMDVTLENIKPGQPDQHYFQKELAQLVCDTSNLKDVYAQENTFFSINCYYYFLQQHINYSYYLDENIRMLSEIKNTNNENNFRGTMGSSLTLNHLENNVMTAVQDENNQCLHTLEYSKNCELSALPSQAHPFVPESPKNLSHIRLYNYIIENMTLDGKFFCDTTHQFIQISKYFKKYDCDELSNDAHSLHKWFENFNQVQLSNNAITRDTTSDRKYLYYTDQNKANLAEYSKYCEFSALSGICHSLMLTGLYENFSHIQLSNIVIENVTVDRKYVSEGNQNESDQLIKFTQNSKNWVLSSDVNPLISSGSVESLKHIKLSSAIIEDMTSERKYFYGSYSSTSWYDFQSAYLNEDVLGLVTKKTIKSTQTTKSNGGNPLISSESVNILNHIELSSATIEDMTSERKYFYGSYSSASWYDFQSAYLNEDTSSLVTRKKGNKCCTICKTETPKVQILEATENNNFDISCQVLTNDWRAVNLIAGYLILRLILPWILTCVIYVFDKTIDVIVLIFLLLYLSVIFVTKY